MNENDVNKRIAERLLKLRKDRGVSVPEISKAIGKSVDSYYAYESGRREIPVSTLVEISAFFGVSIDDIVDNVVTYRREKAVSFDCYSEKGKGKMLISEPEDGIYFFRTDEWTVDYYVKCVEVRYGRKMLIQVESTTFPAIISFDEKANTYIVFNTLIKSSKVFKPKAFLSKVVIIGDYAGTVTEQVKMHDFL